MKNGERMKKHICRNKITNKERMKKQNNKKNVK